MAMERIEHRRAIWMLQDILTAYTRYQQGLDAPQFRLRMASILSSNLDLISGMVTHHRENLNAPLDQDVQEGGPLPGEPAA